MHKWWDTKRACWCIDLIAWSLRVLVPSTYREELCEWAKAQAELELRYMKLWQ